MQRSKLVEQICNERMERLVELAKSKQGKDDELSKKLAKKYVAMAMAIAKHYKVKMPNEIKTRICRKCKNVLVPGLNCSVRKSEKFIIRKCECGAEIKSFVTSTQNARV